MKFIEILILRKYLFNIKIANEEIKLIGVNFTEVMNTWTKQMGHPYVFVNTTNNDSIVITQNHFLLNPDVLPTETSIYKLILLH